MNTFEELAYMPIKKQLNKWKASEHLGIEKAPNVLQLSSILYILISRIIKEGKHFHILLQGEGEFVLEMLMLCINENMSTWM